MVNIKFGYFFGAIRSSTQQVRLHKQLGPGWHVWLLAWMQAHPHPNPPKKIRFSLWFPFEPLDQVSQKQEPGGFFPASTHVTTKSKEVGIPPGLAFALWARLIEYLWCSGPRDGRTIRLFDPTNLGFFLPTDLGFPYETILKAGEILPPRYGLAAERFIS